MDESGRPGWGELKREAYLWGDAAPVVGVQRARLQHRSGQGQVFGHEQVQHAGVGQQVVTVHELKRGEGLQCGSHGV